MFNLTSICTYITKLESPPKKQKKNKKKKKKKIYICFKRSSERNFFYVLKKDASPKLLEQSILHGGEKYQIVVDNCALHYV